nr:MAG TPA: ribonucleoside-diphosphate reductase, class 1b, beta subunit [Caudoviricetes sp.]
MTTTTPNHAQSGDIIDPINWNRIGDQVDKDVWDRLVNNFWVPEKIAVSNDSNTWKLMPEAEQWATMQVFTGLTLLDTMQGTVGALSLMPDATTPHEEAVYTNIAFMESIHAKSYSNIFMTLADTPTINQAFNWGRQNEHLQYKAHRVLDFYKRGNANMRKAASTLLESFLFYSGFYLPLRMAAHSKLTNTADIIRLIIRDEAVHGYYIGYKYQQTVKRLPEEQQAELQGEVVDLLLDLMDNEEHYTREIYDPLGWTEDVLAFLRYNANKALNNLGYEAIYPAELCEFSTAVKTSLDPSGNETHDFFSGSGSSYVIGKAEETTDEDWEF